MIYEIQAPDGKTYEIEVPEGTSKEDAIRFLQSQLGGQVESQKARTFAQGATFGFADEVEAGIRSAFSGDEYADVRDKIRKQLADYSNQNGAEALALEIAGSSIPTLVSQFIPVLGQSATAANVSRLATMADRMKRASKIGAAEGAVAGAGYSESDSLGGIAGDVVTGAGLGATIAPIAGEAITKGISKLGDIVSEASKRFGQKGATAVEQELRRIAQATGKSEQELIADIMDGRVISDNRTLAATIRALSSKSDEAKDVLKKSYDTRGEQTLKDFREARDLSLTGSTEAPNISALTDFDDQQKLVSSLYNQAQQSPEFVSDEVGQVLSVIDKYMPNATKAVKRSSEAMAERPQASPTDAIMGRVPQAPAAPMKPTIQQAENVLRQIKQEINGFYKGQVDIDSKYGLTIEALNDFKDNLERSIDMSSPAMRNARAQAAKRFSEIEAFDTGRKMARKPTDVQEEMLMQLGKRRELSPEEMARARQGASASLRTRTGMPTEYSDVRAMANVESPQSSLLDLLGAQDTNMVRGKAQLADDVNVMRGIVDPSKGSITQFAQEASNKFGVNINPAEILSAVNGDVAGLLSLGTKVVKGLFKSGLSESQYKELAELLVSQDPTIIRNALLGNETNEQIALQIKNIATKSGIIAGDITRTVTAQQASQE